MTTWTSGTTAMKIDAGFVSVNWTVDLSTALVVPGATIVAEERGRPLLECQDALHAVAHVLGRDLRAVVELRPPPQLERVREAVRRDRVALGQPRLELRRVVEPAVEAVVEVQPHGHAPDVEGGVRVHRVVRALVGEHEPGLRGCRGARSRQRHEGKHESEPGTAVGHGRPPRAGMSEAAMWRGSYHGGAEVAVAVEHPQRARAWRRAARSVAGRVDVAARVEDHTVVVAGGLGATRSPRRRRGPRARRADRADRPSRRPRWWPGAPRRPCNHVAVGHRGQHPLVRAARVHHAAAGTARVAAVHAGAAGTGCCPGGSRSPPRRPGARSRGSPRSRRGSGPGPPESWWSA